MIYIVFNLYLIEQGPFKISLLQNAMHIDEENECE